METRFGFRRIGWGAALLLIGGFVVSVHSATNPPPAFTSLIVSNQNVWMDITGRAGKFYRVQKTDAVTNETWALVSEFTPGVTNFSVTNIESGTVTCRFYRAVMMPGTNPPAFPAGTELDFGIPEQGRVRLSWKPATDILEVARYDIYQNGILVTNVSGTQACVTVTGVVAGATYTYRIEAVNEDSVTNRGPDVAVTPIPPDPALVAPPLENGAATLVQPATAFLYTNNVPIQTGMSSNTIDSSRAVMLRGKVTDIDGNGLYGAVISVRNHKEYGRTVSRIDGQYDLSINGGDTVILDYERDGYLSLYRKVTPSWQTYQTVSDVALVTLDSNVTTIQLPSTGAMMVVEGSLSVDDAGPRRSILLIPQGTTAYMEFSDGTTQTLSAANIRITEYTRGPNGVTAMPAELPPTSDYTYAADLTVDEALAADACGVCFNQTLYHYLTNFIGMPVGVPVPYGSLDDETGVWVPLPDGRVIRIVGVTAGLADIDSDGDDSADDGLGLSNPERERLAALFAVGTELWRMPVASFSRKDPNYGSGQAGSDEPPKNSDKDGEKVKDKDGEKDDGHGEAELQNQIFHEDISIAGTSFRLCYSSDRMPGYLEDNTVDLQLTTNSVSAELKRVDVELLIAGRKITNSFPSAPDLAWSYTWDGKDMYGRLLQGRQKAIYRIGYVFKGYYTRPPVMTESFGWANAVFITNRLAQYVPSRRDVTVWHEGEIELGQTQTLADSLGGWTLNIHHVFDPVQRVIFRGNGERQDLDGFSGQVMTFTAGTGVNGFGGDGGDAGSAQLNNPGGTASAGDGSYYVADTDNHRVRRITSSNTIETVAGTGVAGHLGDGGVATNAQLRSPRGLSLAGDGSLYIADSSNNCIRCLRTNGVIITVAGTGTAGYTGDGGAATNARLNGPCGVTFTADGALYIADTENHCVRRVAPNGTIRTVAGTGAGGYSGDGGSASGAQLNRPQGVTVDSGGRIYVADTDNNRVRRINPGGWISTYAGTGSAGYSGDGGSAADATMDHPVALAIGNGNTLYVADASNNCVRQIGSSRTISTVAGTGNAGYSGNSGPAAQAQLNRPQALTVGPDGRACVADSGNGAIQVIGPSLVPAKAAQLQIASDDGNEVYVFDSVGRHIQTRDAFTGNQVYNFLYDSFGRMVQVVDWNSKTTTIQRTGLGSPTAVVAPYGQVTTLEINSTGHLETVTGPLGDVTRMTYASNGLLTSITGANLERFSFQYDALGRIVQMVNPDGGTSTLQRATANDGHTVTLSNELGRTSQYAVEFDSAGGQRLQTTWPDRTQSRTVVRGDGTRTNTLADGTVICTQEAPDPRFGMQAPFARLMTVRTPAGRLFSNEVSRIVRLSDPRNNLSLVAWTNASLVNGRLFRDAYDPVGRRFTSCTPLGRTTSLTVDSAGRTANVIAYNWGAVSNSYNIDGQVTVRTLGAGPDARAFTFGYDPAGHLDEVVDPLSRTNRYLCDARGQVTNSLTPDGRTLTLAYDGEGRLLSVAPPGRPAHTFNYSPVGIATQYVPPVVGNVTNSVGWTQNTDRELTQHRRADGVSVNYARNAYGQLTGVSCPEETYTFGYNTDSGQLTNIAAVVGASLAFTYDGFLLLTEQWTSGGITGIVAMTWDNDFRAASWRVNGGGAVSNTYNADGFLVQAGYSAIARDAVNGSIVGVTVSNITETRAYNAFGEVTNLSIRHSGANLLSLSYNRDRLGRITNIVETAPGGVRTNTYLHDLAGRLTVAQSSGMAPSAYLYDSNGNRTNAVVSGVPISAVYDAQDRLVSYGAALYTYSPDGEVTNITTGVRYQYDSLGRLRTAAIPGSTNIVYQADARGRRTAKWVNDVLTQGFLYRGALRPIAELDGGTNVVSVFTYGSRGNVPDYMVKGGTIYRLVCDHLGSVRVVVNADTGVVAQRLDYDEFGRVLLDTNPGFQPFGFVGGLYDKDTGIVHFGAREYDAVTGRWFSRDPILFRGGSANLYAYCDSDPVSRSDYCGTGPELEKLRKDIEQAESRTKYWQEEQQALRERVESYYRYLDNPTGDPPEGWYTQTRYDGSTVYPWSIDPEDSDWFRRSTADAIAKQSTQQWLDAAKADLKTAEARIEVIVQERVDDARSHTGPYLGHY